MAATNPLSILARKAAQGTLDQEARVMSVPKAMRLSLAKLGKDVFEMPLSMIGAVAEERRASEISELIGETDLLCLLEDDRGRVGAAVIGSDIVVGLIQQQTMGKVDVSDGKSRPLTATDAAMCTPLLDGLFERVTPILEVEAERDILSDFRLSARFEDARSLGIALEMPEYFVVRLTLDLAVGARQGDLKLILPMADQTNPDDQDVQNEESTLVDDGPKMSDIAMGLPVELNMVLCKFSIELSAVEQLAIGAVLHLPPNTFPETEIVTETGTSIGSGVLGQVNGTRALRLKRSPSYADQPRRRESDLPELDLPEIEALPDKRREKKNSLEYEESLQSQGNDRSDVVTSIETGTSTQVLEEPASIVPKLTRGETGLPELDDFPDLAELAQAN
jgi:flagellar motor switch/type III secretory pathway protein FliN